jgi:uncharacterized membrane protein (DUF373 family)
MQPPKELIMRLKEEFSAEHLRWQPLTLYQKFEHAIILTLTGLIAIVIIAAVWSLTLRILSDLILARSFDPTDHIAFQSVFGMIFTVIIALEFKRSLLLLTERAETVVQVRTVILIAILAIVRKFIILDLTATNALQLLALAAAILSLGGVYWMVREQDRRQSEQPGETSQSIPG